jgi:TonB family protein
MPPDETLPARRVLLLPPPEVLRPPRDQRLHQPPPPQEEAAQPHTATPTPPPKPPEALRDRISIGPRSEERSQRPLLLRRDEDLASEPGKAGSRGEKQAQAADAGKAPREERVGPAGSASPLPIAVPAPEVKAQAGLDPGAAPQGPGGIPIRRGPTAAVTPPPLSGQRSIAESLRKFEQRLGQGGDLGAAGAAGQRMGPLFFDPEGADFTAWINHFKNEVYRNWVVPESVLMGFHGHVDIDFTVERDGRISTIAIVKTAGTPSLDRAAQNALLASRFLPLPADFAPSRVHMQASFFYNETPQGS